MTDVAAGACKHGKPIHYAYPCRQCWADLTHEEWNAKLDSIKDYHNKSVEEIDAMLTKEPK